MKTRKSWREKLTDSKGLPKSGEVMGKMTKRWGTGTMVVPAPIEVDEIMKQVPKGKLITINEIRAALARKHHADFACPITPEFLPGSLLMPRKKPPRKAKLALLLTGGR